MNSGKQNFKSDIFESSQSSDVRSHAISLGATHFYMDIGYNINPISHTTTFDIQNESRHFERRDSSMSRDTPFDVTDFGSNFCYSHKFKFITV
jgi:hypothetical protein